MEGKKKKKSTPSQKLIVVKVLKLQKNQFCCRKETNSSLQILFKQIKIRTSMRNANRADRIIRNGTDCGRNYETIIFQFVVCRDNSTLVFNIVQSIFQFMDISSHTCIADFLLFLVRRMGRAGHHEIADYIITEICVCV